jgi:hypothetical protein
MAHIQRIRAIPKLRQRDLKMMDKIEYLLMLAEDNRADNAEWGAEVRQIGHTRYKRSLELLQMIETAKAIAESEVRKLEHFSPTPPDRRIAPQEKVNDRPTANSRTDSGSPKTSISAN